QTILRMLPDDAIVNGTVEFNGENLLGFSERQMRQVRTKEISMIFQEPGLTLNPLMRVGQQVLEAARLDTSIPANKRESEVIIMLEEVGLKKDVYKKYPHELSGGMKQRVI